MADGRAGARGRRAPVVCATVFFGMLGGSVVDAMGVVLFLLSLSPTCRLEGYEHQVRRGYQMR